MEQPYPPHGARRGDEALDEARAAASRLIVELARALPATDGPSANLVAMMAAQKAAVDVVDHLDAIAEHMRAGDQ